MKRLKKSVNIKISRIIIIVLAVTMFTPISVLNQENRVLADSQGKGIYNSVNAVEETVGENTTNSQIEISTEETESTGVETTVEESTTEEPTTKEVTTAPPTTEAPTTNKVNVKVEPWGKNSKGQFVNGNKKVIVGATMKGIDVSHHNGKIDWKKVAKSDVDYAIIRCGYGDNYVSQDDGRWKENVKGCEDNKIPYGVYIYSYALTTDQAKSEAEHVIRLIKGHTLSFPIYYDMEDATQARLSASARQKIANTFLSIIKAHGYECGIYANLNWWNNYLPKELADNTAWKWVAQYNNNACTYKGTYQMWQCTSEGRVSGVQGDVDINFWFGDVRNASYNIYKPETKAKPVTKPGRVTIKSLKSGKKKMTVKVKKVSGAKGYRIQYSTSKKFKSKKTKYTTKTKLKINKLKSKKKYYVRVKAYKINAFKNKVYSKQWSKIKKVKIK